MCVSTNFKLTGGGEIESENKSGILNNCEFAFEVEQNQPKKDAKKTRHPQSTSKQKKFRIPDFDSKMMGGVPPGRVFGPRPPGDVGPQEVRDRRAEAGDGGGDRAMKKAGKGKWFVTRVA